MGSPKKLFGEDSPATSAAPEAQEQGTSITVAGTILEMGRIPLLSLEKQIVGIVSSPPAEPSVKAKPPSPPAVTPVLASDVKPNAASSPKEEPNGLDDSVNGAPAKRPHSPEEEEMAKRHKDAEVTRLFSAAGEQQPGS